MLLFLYGALSNNELLQVYFVGKGCEQESGGLADGDDCLQIVTHSDIIFARLSAPLFHCPKFHNV